MKAELDGRPGIDMPTPEHGPQQFTVEADYFADCIRNNKEPKSDGQEGLRDTEYMSQIYQSAGLPGL
jgi:predicted dehydrogenase